MLITILLVLVLVLLCVLVFLSMEERRRRRESLPRARLGSFWDGKERRKSRRCEICSEVRYEPEKKSPRKMTARSKNMSASGVRLILEEILPEGTPLIMEMDIAGDGKPVTAKGEVVWMQEVKSEKTGAGGSRIFEAGIKFTYLAPGDESRLRKYLPSH